jgi:hypothetical protein
MSDDDLVRRLRCYADIDDAVFHPWVYGEAADHIEKLEGELHHCFHRIEELQAALRGVIAIADTPAKHWREKMTLVEMLRANGSWEADAAVTAIQMRDRRIAKLESALRILANITDCDTEGKLPVDTKLTWARQKLFDVRQLARKTLDAK